MNVTINGMPHELSDGTSLATAVALLTRAGAGVAAAVNGAVVRRPDWGGTSLADGDSVEVLTAVQGG
ncbi:MAG TPA: sulfur carrier protein ThiS [Streptosporangiaceae bacterium]|jgi:sulfur carrier protein